MQAGTFLTEVTKGIKKAGFNGSSSGGCLRYVRAGKILLVVTKDLEKRTVPFPAEIARNILKKRE